LLMASLTLDKAANQVVQYPAHSPAHTGSSLTSPQRVHDPHCKGPAPTRKLKQDKAYWATWKLILGWVIDTVAMTLELPIHRQEPLHTILLEVLTTQKCISVKKWQQILGEFRSMTIAIPGRRGLFSLLQEALRHQSECCLCLSRIVHDTLDDFSCLATDLASWQTHMHKTVPQPSPELAGAQDAARSGMGGVWFPASTRLQEQLTTAGSPAKSSARRPILWRSRFFNNTYHKLVSFENPSGTITNLDLSWRHPLYSTMLRRINSMSARTPLPVDLTTLPLSPGSAKAPLLPREPPPTCCISSCCINASIATTHSSSFPAKSMPWQMIVCNCGISLTQNFSPILNSITRRPLPGA
jgi:hypothetical protein